MCVRVCACVCACVCVARAQPTPPKPDAVWDSAPVIASVLPLIDHANMLVPGVCVCVCVCVCVICGVQNVGMPPIQH